MFNHNLNSRNSGLLQANQGREEGQDGSVGQEGHGEVLPGNASACAHSRICKIVRIR